MAVDLPAVTRDSIAAVLPTQLADTRLTIQPGTHYLEASRPVDDLIRLYSADDAQDRIELPETDVWVEVRGSRGSFRFARLTRATFAFRTALVSGLSIGDSAERAWTADISFDPGAALAQLVNAGLVIAIAGRAQGSF